MKLFFIKFPMQRENYARKQSGDITIAFMLSFRVSLSSLGSSVVIFWRHKTLESRQFF